MLESFKILDFVDCFILFLVENFIFLYVPADINFLNFAFEILLCPGLDFVVSVNMAGCFGKFESLDKDCEISSRNCSIITFYRKISLNLPENLKEQENHK